MIISNLAITGTDNDFGNLIKQSFPATHLKEFNNISNISNVIEETKDTEIFINYEYNNNLQLEITKQWFEAHHNKKHLIINIMWSEKVIKSDQAYVEYFQAKKDLNEFSWEVNLAEKDCLCILISPGLEDNLSASIERADRFKENKLDISKEIIDIINWTITKFYEI